METRRIACIFGGAQTRGGGDCSYTARGIKTTKQAFQTHFMVCIVAAMLCLYSFADTRNPCCAYLWECGAFQTLLDTCCSCCAGLLQPTAAAAVASSNPASVNSTSTSSLALRQLSSQSCSSVFAAFAAAAAPSEQLWGLAKKHMAQQQQMQQEQQQEQQQFLRSGTMLSNEVATARTAALLQRCSVGLGVLQAAAAIVAEAKQPLPIAAVRPAQHDLPVHLSCMLGVSLFLPATLP